MTPERFQQALEQVRQHADLIAITRRDVPDLAGDPIAKGTCPFCQKAGALNVHSTRRFFHCFGCKESGSAIDWLMRLHHVDFETAVLFLAETILAKETQE